MIIFMLFEFFVVWRCSIWRWKRTKYLGYFHSWTPRLFLITSLSFCNFENINIMFFSVMCVRTYNISNMCPITIPSDRCTYKTNIMWFPSKKICTYFNLGSFYGTVRKLTFLKKLIFILMLDSFLNCWLLINDR